ncbi:MAG: flagellar biosynthetic protein FliO [Eubacteriales bacterium]|nr:flagellar biosynthetic protein FliO [Eubacteriales bacterium]
MALAVTGGRLEAFAQLITLLVIFALVLALTYFTTRWVGNFQKNKLAGSNIQILETMRISNSKYIQVVKVGKKCFTIAVCKDTVTYLCEVDENDLVYSGTSSDKVNSESFKAILEKFKKDKPD